MQPDWVVLLGRGRWRLVFLPARPALVALPSLQARRHWIWEPKYDGVRTLVRWRWRAAPVARTRHDEPTDLPDVQGLVVPPCSVLDGELYRGVWIVWDWLLWDGELGSALSLADRYARLCDTLPQVGPTRVIHRLDPDDALDAQRHEGVVLKGPGGYPYGETCRWLRHRW